MHSEPSPTHAYNIAHITFGVAAALDHDMHADDSTVWLFEPLVPTPLPSAQQHGSVQPFSDVDSNRSPFTDGDDSAESRNNSVSFDISDVTDEAPSNEGALIPPVALDPRLRSSPHRLDRIAMRNASLTVRVTEGVSVTPPKLPQSLPQGSPQLMQSPPSLEPQTPQKDRAGSSLGEPRDHTSADVALAVLNCWDRLLVEFDADALLPSPVQGPWTSNLPCTFAHALLRVSWWLLDRLPADSPRAPKVIVRLKQCVGVLLASLDAESRCGTVIESAESMRAANQGRSRSRSGSAGFSTPLSDVTPSPMATPSVANAKQWILFVMWYCHELLRKVTAKLQSSAEGSGVPDPGSLIATVTAVARGVVDILSLIAAVAPAVFASSTFDESTLRLFIRTIVTASNFNIRPVRVSSVDNDGVTEREEVDDPTDSPLATAAAAGGCVILPYWMSHTWLSQPAWVSDVPAAVSAVLCSFDVWTDATSALRAAFVNEQSSNVTAGPSMPPLSSLGDSWVKAESEGVALLNTMSLHDMQRWSVSNSQREDESQLSLKRCAHLHANLVYHCSYLVYGCRYRRLLKCVQTPRGVWDTYWCDVIRWKMCVELDGKKRRLFLRRNFGFVGICCLK